METRTKASDSFVVFAAINASLGLLNLAYQVCIFNSLQKILEEHIFPDASTQTISFLASSPFLGAVIGALFTESIGRNLGRRVTMILSNTVALVGAILTLFSNIPSVLIGRVLAGIEGGVASVIVEVYITEITREPMRGQLGGIPNIAASGGIILSFLLGLLTPMFIEREITDIGYRMLFLVPAILSAVKILNLLFLFKFETPFYLVYAKKEGEAKEVLELLYEDGHSEKLDELIQERDYIFQNEGISLKDLFSAKYRKVLFISSVASLSPYFMGLIAPTAFSNMIFSEGLDPEEKYLPIFLTNLIGFLAFVSSLFALIIFRYVGRRTLALVSTAVLLVIMLVMAIICYTSSVGHFAVKILLILWTCVYYLSYGVIGFLYPAESLPEIGVGVVTTLSLVAGLVATQAFLPLKNTVGYEGVFLTFIGFSLITYTILYFYMVESRSRTKLDILKRYAGYDQEEKEILREKES